MRSDLVFAAKVILPNRYTLCWVVSSATRRFHRPILELRRPRMLFYYTSPTQGRRPLALDRSNTFNMREALHQDLSLCTLLISD